MGSALLIAFHINTISPPVILHFDALQGIDMFGERIDIWGIWLITAVAVLANIFLARAFFHKERLVSYILISVTPLLSLLLLIAIGTIISVN